MRASPRSRAPAQCPLFRCRQSAASRADAEGIGLATASPHIDHLTNAARTGPRAPLRYSAVGSASFLPAASGSPFVGEVDTGRALIGPIATCAAKRDTAPAEGMAIGCPKNSAHLAEQSSDGARRPEQTDEERPKRLRHARAESSPFQHFHPPRSGVKNAANRGQKPRPAAGFAWYAEDAAGIMPYPKIELFHGIRRRLRLQ